MTIKERKVLRTVKSMVGEIDRGIAANVDYGDFVGEHVRPFLEFSSAAIQDNTLTDEAGMIALMGIARAHEYMRNKMH